MLLWTIAIVLLACWIVAGYYQGAVRAGFTLVGLLLGAFLSLPLSGLGRSILSVFGLEHPVVLDFLSPTIIFLLLFIIFKALGFFVHSKVHHYYKYRTEDQQRVFWERFNQQIGVCLGAANGFVTILLVCIGIYAPGYFLVQVVSSDKDPWWLKLVSTFSQDLEKTGFYRGLSPLVPASDFYFEAADTLGLLFRNPGLQERLSRYPLFLPWAEEAVFQEVGKDTAFQDLWKQGPSLKEFMAHERVGPLIRDKELYGRLVQLLKDDLPDLQTYLETGISPKFAEQRILDRWFFNFPASYNQAKRVKPNMTVAEKRWLYSVYQTSWMDAVLTAFLDHTILLKNKSSSGKPQSLKGKWTHAYGAKHLIQLREGGKWNEFEALVDTNRLTLTMEKLTLVFDK